MEYYPELFLEDQLHVKIDGTADKEMIKGIGIQAAVMAAQRAHPFLKKCMEYYQNRHFKSDNLTMLAPHIYALIARDFGFKYKNKEQQLKNGMILLKSEFFAPDVFKRTENTKLVHLCYGSWRKLPASFRKKQFSEIYQKLNNKSYLENPISCSIFEPKHNWQISKIISFFIPYKPLRHRLRDFIRNFYFKDIGEIFKFNLTKIRDNSILLIEMNDSHGEVMAGLIPYLQKLNLKIDILLHPYVFKENPFSLLDTREIHFFKSHPKQMHNFLKKQKIQAYKNVLLMSSAGYFLINSPKSILQNYPELKKIESLSIIEHDTRDIILFQEDDLLEKNRILTLCPFLKNRADLVFISPILYSQRQIKEKNKTTCFITIGAIEKQRKNHQLLIEAIKELVQKNYDFKVIVIGLGNFEDLPKELHKYIEIKGRLSFPEMFSELGKADFFLPLLDDKNKEHDRYITSGVTGSAQLIYGFQKIPIIHKKFASFYYFTNLNSITYSNLSVGMERGILMSNAEYKKKQKNLQVLSETLEKETITNLKKVLNLNAKKKNKN